MGTRHDLLTEEEMASFSMNGKVIKQLKAYMKSSKNNSPDKINVLDWGCGRGRSVAKLHEQGFNAFGVEIDSKTLSNGFSLFKERGLSPDVFLRTVDEASSFDSGFFHFIYSEQVFEHVADLDLVVKEMARLTAPGGMGVHRFPGSANIWEDHLQMPFVHWFPKNIIRKYWIWIMLMLPYGCKDPWHQTNNKSCWSAAHTYYEYMNNHTFYRNTAEITDIFKSYGFNSRYEIYDRGSRFMKFIPKYQLGNGFPKGSVVFISQKI